MKPELKNPTYLFYILHLRQLLRHPSEVSQRLSNILTITVGRRSRPSGDMNCGQQAAAAAALGGRARRRTARTPLPALARRATCGAREERYAASKWGAAPAAAALPPPPTHWRRDGRCRLEPDRALPLKLLLNVA